MRKSQNLRSPQVNFLNLACVQAYSNAKQSIAFNAARDVAQVIGFGC